MRTHEHAHTHTNTAAVLVALVGEGLTLFASLRT